MRFPFTASEESVSIFLNGRMHNLASSLKGFAELVEHLKGSDHDAEFIENIIDRPSMVARLTAGAVTVVGTTVFHNGVPAHSTLTVKLIEMLDAGFDAGPWINFFVKVMQNPSERSRQCLYDFLEKWKAPLTPCGDFIAFKYVSDDYMDQRTGTFDNHPGKAPSMPRADVDPDPDKTCSKGLHVCASVYLSEYNVGARIVAVQVNPANVVAVPRDYNHAKMRVCDYLVLSDVENPHGGGIAAIEAQQVYVPENYSGETLDDDPDDTYNDYYDGDDDGSAAVEQDIVALGADVDYDGWDNHPDLVDEPEDAPSPEILGGPFFTTTAGDVYASKVLLEGVAKLGQRGYATVTGIPRSTLQGWLSSLAK